MTVHVAARLRDDRPVDVRGAALTARLLTAGNSPLDPNSGASVRRAVRAAHVAMDAPAPCGQALPAAA